MHPKSVSQTRLMAILTNLDNQKSELFYFAAKYIMTTLTSAGIDSTQGSYQKILNIILDRGIRNVKDVSLIQTITDEQNVLKVMIFLAKTAGSSKVWHRICMQALRFLVIKFQQKNEVREWTLLFSKRVFEFIVLSNVHKKYIGRSMLYCEDMSMFLGIRLQWLQIVVNSYIASVLFTKRQPSFFRQFFISKGSVDDAYASEIEAFVCDTSVSLKAFPYDNSHTGIVVPPPIDLLAKRQVTRSSSSRSFTPAKPVVAPQIKKENVVKKKVEKFIRKPVSGAKQITRPLASAIYIAPINRR